MSADADNNKAARGKKTTQAPLKTQISSEDEDLDCSVSHKEEIVKGEYYLEEDVIEDSDYHTPPGQEDSKEGILQFSAMAAPDTMHGMRSSSGRLIKKKKYFSPNATDFSIPVNIYGSSAKPTTTPAFRSVNTEKNPKSITVQVVDCSVELGKRITPSETGTTKLPSSKRSGRTITYTAITASKRGRRSSPKTTTEPPRKRGCKRLPPSQSSTTVKEEPAPQSDTDSEEDAGTVAAPSESQSLGSSTKTERKRSCRWSSDESKMRMKKLLDDSEESEDLDDPEIVDPVPGRAGSEECPENCRCSKCGGTKTLRGQISRKYVGPIQRQTINTQSGKKRTFMIVKSASLKQMEAQGLIETLKASELEHQGLKDPVKTSDLEAHGLLSPLGTKANLNASGAAPTKKVSPIVKYVRLSPRAFAEANLKRLQKIKESPHINLPANSDNPPAGSEKDPSSSKTGNIQEKKVPPCSYQVSVTGGKGADAANTLTLTVQLPPGASTKDTGMPTDENSSTSASVSPAKGTILFPTSFLETGQVPAKNATIPKPGTTSTASDKHMDAASDGLSDTEEDVPGSPSASQSLEVPDKTSILGYATGPASLRRGGVKMYRFQRRPDKEGDSEQTEEQVKDVQWVGLPTDTRTKMAAAQAMDQAVPLASYPAKRERLKKSVNKEMKKLYFRELRRQRQRYQELLKKYKALQDQVLQHKDVGTPEQVLRDAAKYLSVEQSLLLESQMRNCNRPRYGARYSKFKSLLLQYFNRSPPGYRYLEKIFRLPQYRTITKWKQFLNTSTNSKENDMFLQSVDGNTTEESDFVHHKKRECDRNTKRKHHDKKEVKGTRADMTDHTDVSGSEDSEAEGTVMGQDGLSPKKRVIEVNEGIKLEWVECPDSLWGDF